ncbi:hypothetical protein [Limosilactobacillus reuteri]|uniref:hypothetical protein n=1 Tax=Limosilactobacillus reuteri TaxID=1598 RepID=UPI003D01C159
MREIKIPYVTQKRTDNLEKYLIKLIDDGKPTLLDQSVNYRAFITYDGSLVTPTGIELTIQDNQLVLDSAKLDFPAGIYRFEIWAEKDGQRAIYPDTGMKRLVINANATDLPNGTVTSLTLDEFIEQFKEATKGIKGQGPNADISIDVAKRTITINGKSLTIPEPVDLGGLASKDDIAGLVKQTELAEYVKKNDLPDLTGYAKMSDLPSVTDLVNKSELANYAKKSDLPVIPDLTPFLKTADADKKFATKSEIPSLDGYARKTDLSNYATKDDLKTVTSNTTRHAPTAWTLDRTTNPWTIWFDNGCGLQFLDYSTVPTVYGYGFSVNTQNTNINTWPLMGTIISASRGTLTLDNISKLHGSADYWGPNTTVINPIKTDASNYDWSNVYFNDEDRAKSDDYRYNRQRNIFRVMYELGIWSIDDIKPFGLTKKEG